MPESSSYPSLVALPSAPRRKLGDNDTKAIATMMLWASDLQRALANQFNAISPTNIGGGVGPPVSAHAPTHQPASGSDPLATTAPTGGYGTSAAVGTGDSFLRNDARFPFPEALGTLADRTKTLTLTQDVNYDALVTAGTAFTGGIAFPSSQKGLSFLAPGGTVPFCIGPNGTMGRAQYTNEALMLHAFAVLPGSSRVYGWQLSNLIAGRPDPVGDPSAVSTGGMTGAVITLQDKPTSNSSQQIIGVDISVTPSTDPATDGVYHPAVTASNGIATGVKASVSYGGSSASRAGIRLFEGRVPTIYSSQTVGFVTFYECTQVPLIGGAITGRVVGFRQAVAFGSTLGSARRGVEVINSIECTLNDVITSGAGKGMVMKDGIDGNYYRLSTQNGVLMITNVGATAPTS